MSFIDLRKNENFSPPFADVNLTESENTIILFVCPVKFRICIVFCFSWDLQWSQEKTKTMLIQRFGGQTKSLLTSQKAHQSIAGLHPPFRQYPFINLGGERHRVSLPKNTTQCPQPGPEPGPLDPESSALTMGPPRLSGRTKSIVVFSPLANSF